MSVSASSSVLIVSADSGFGELVQITLEQDGRCQPLLLRRAEDALLQAQSTPFALAILDTGFEDMSLVELGRALWTLRPDLPIIAIPPDNDPTSPALQGMKFQGYLSKPFYLPDLTRTVSSLLDPSLQQDERPLAQSAIAIPVELGGSLAWLQDVDRAARYLARLSLESAAHAALIVRGDQLWAYAGHLPQPAAQELAEVLIKHRGAGDLARFVHLKTTDGDYMLYATPLAGDLALALAFDAATPFTKMRSQAANLAKALANPPLDTASLPEAPPSPAASETPSLPAPSLASPPPVTESPPIPMMTLEPLPSTDDEDIPVLDLGDVPPPNPGRAKRARKAPPIAVSLQPEILEEKSSVGIKPAFGIDALPVALPPDVKPAPPAGVRTKTEWRPPENPLPIEEMETRPTVVEVGRENETLSSPLSAVAPTIVRERLVAPRFEPPTPAIVSLSFACVLIPRLPQHHLVGDLAERLPDIMAQVCVSFGWRIEHIAVRPDYLQWLVSVPPATSPSYLMRISRQQTSQRLFIEFPAMSQENLSGDFWAPGYLIMSSHQPPPPQVVKDFILNTRRYQGA